MASALKKLLESELGGHVRVHTGPGDERPIRLTVSSTQGAQQASKKTHDMQIVRRLPVFIASCGSIMRSGVEGAEPGPLVLLLRSSSKRHFYVETGGTGKQPTLSRVSTGKTAEVLQRALLRMARLAAARKHRGELRVFRVPAMHLSALWLHDSKGDTAGLWIPYTPNFAGLLPGRVYTYSRFVSLLKKHATQLILRWYDRFEREASNPKA